MKMRKIGLAALMTLSSSVAFADSYLTMQPEINPIVINGGKVGSELFTSEHGLTLRDGENQLLVSVGQIVFEDAKRRKYNSSPYIITFPASEQTLSLTYDKMRTMDDAKAFEQSPSFSLKTKSGESISYQIDQLNATGLLSFRDYQQELLAYNQEKSGSAAMSVATPVAGVSNAFVVEDPTSLKPVKANPESKMKFLTTAFSDLTAEEQQKFMQSAMHNLK